MLPAKPLLGNAQLGRGEEVEVPCHFYKRKPRVYNVSTLEVGEGGEGKEKSKPHSGKAQVVSALEAALTRRTHIPTHTHSALTITNPTVGHVYVNSTAT